MKESSEEKRTCRPRKNWLRMLQNKTRKSKTWAKSNKKKNNKSRSNLSQLKKSSSRKCLKMMTSIKSRLEVSSTIEVETVSLWEWVTPKNHFLLLILNQARSTASRVILEKCHLCVKQVA